MSQATKNNVSELNADVSMQMSILRDDIASLTATVAEYGKAQGTHLKTAAAEKATEMADTGANAAGAIKQQAEKTYSDTEEAVRANPATAIGIAASVGFLIGMISARR